MEKYCVFGGFGFIGQYIVNQLRSEGHRVVVIGSKMRNIEDYYHWGGLTYLKLEQIMEKVDGVINLAYASTPKTSFDDPITDIKDNLPSVINFLEWMSMFSVKRIVMVSTGGAIYGNTNENPISETAATNPISPYGITKLAVEKYSSMYYSHKKLPVITVRPGNAYGIGQSPFAGQGFIATATYSILENKGMEIYGKNGTIRDYIHVKDVADGIIAALKKGKIGQTYNVGTGRGVSTKYVFDYISKIAVKAGYIVPKVKNAKLRPFDVRKNVLDSSKLKSDTGWHSQITLEDGINEYWNHSLKDYNAKSIERVMWV
ncbi:NAD-dependent epimerase/dehydratase family protein [Zunongwangia sp. HRR-M8]|uniref:NAD-dependent epimerase/dehydratase family protein n=1 Tax=Zunongwangia sp. HRR-M8 TaxID=3015170 RepID=UPI0022DCEC6E|nr:NAD-dependent epimerase/dehydratase family protein [Zunongwangia sp. HRR-M8]WBL21661.1 GDP-mannose 4,6-dehydratase [Zunongwangia sp. HRR-M8]